MIDEATRSWAAQRLAILSAHLMPDAQDIQALRKAGVSESRIAALYPFDAIEWLPGIFELTFNVEPHVGYDLGPTPSTEQQVTELLRGSSAVYPLEIASSIDRSCHTPDFIMAYNQAYDPASPSSESDALHLTVILLHLIATGRARLDQRPSLAGRWVYNLPHWQKLVDEISQLLDSQQWFARAVDL